MWALILLILWTIYLNRERIYLQLGWYARAFDLKQCDLKTISPQPPNTYYPNLRLTAAIRQCVLDHHGGAYVLFGPAGAGKATTVSHILQSMCAAGEVARAILLDGKAYGSSVIGKKKVTCALDTQCILSHLCCPRAQAIARRFVSQGAGQTKDCHFHQKFRTRHAPRQTSCFSVDDFLVCAGKWQAWILCHYCFDVLSARLQVNVRVESRNYSLGHGKRLFLAVR